MKIYILLIISVNSIINTLSPEVIVPSALIFGYYPEVRTAGEHLEPLPGSFSHAATAKSTRKYVDAIFEKGVSK